MPLTDLASKQGVRGVQLHKKGGRKGEGASGVIGLEGGRRGLSQHDRGVVPLPSPVLLLYHPHSSLLRLSSKQSNQIKIN
jgi:hypothetical protein